MVLQLRRPVVQAPMAGGPSTPALAAAVSGAGGLGCLAAGYRTPDAVREEVRAVRALTGERFAVNVFVPTTNESVYDPGPTEYPKLKRPLKVPFQ